MSELNYIGMVEAVLAVKIDAVSEWEESFLTDIKKKYGSSSIPLSPKQKDVIKNIHEKYMVKRGRG
jgi:hypothetical protein